MISTEKRLETITGVGYSLLENSFNAGVEIGNTVLKENHLLDETLFFLFATSDHNVTELMNGVRSVVGDKPAFFGCTTKGLVTHDHIFYMGQIAGGGFISSSHPFFQIYFEETIKDREFEAGKSLARSIQQGETPPDANFILFYDSIKQTLSEGAPLLNIATPILEGFREQFGSWPMIAGIGAFSDLNFDTPSYVWAGDKKNRQGLGAAAIHGGIQMDQIILRGTRPIGGYYTITRTEGNVIYEIDNRPALEMVSEIMGSELSWEEFPFFVTFGVNNGDKFGQYDEDNYYSRICFAVNKEDKSLIMFESDFVNGMEVQLMRRDINFDYIKPRVDKLLGNLGDRKPVFALYIDCIGRVSVFAGMPDEEAEVVAKAVGDIPFLGIFSGVEIGKVGKDIKALDWTGVLCIFSVAEA